MKYFPDGWANREVFELHLKSPSIPLLPHFQRGKRFQRGMMTGSPL